MFLYLCFYVGLFLCVKNWFCFFKKIIFRSYSRFLGHNVLLLKKYILSENVNKLTKNSPGPISLFYRRKFLKKIKTKKDRCIKKTGMKTQVFKTPGAEVLLLQEPSIESRPSDWNRKSLKKKSWSRDFAKNFGRQSPSMKNCKEEGGRRPLEKGRFKKNKRKDVT